MRGVYGPGGSRLAAAPLRHRLRGGPGERRDAPLLELPAADALIVGGRLSMPVAEPAAAALEGAMRSF